MERITFRVDDVSANTDMENLSYYYDFLKRLYDVEFILCVSPISKSSYEHGSVYPDPPFKGRDRKFFYNADRLVSVHRVRSYGFSKIASHGLLHIDHSTMGREAQEISILTSCALLETKIFVPPFNRYNDVTDEICRDNGIQMFSPRDGWRSFESEPFDPAHKLWFFHPWRFGRESFRRTFLRESVTKSEGTVSVNG